MTERRSRWERGLAIGTGATALGLAGAMAAGRAAARRLRSRPDPEAGVPFDTLPPQDLGFATAPDGAKIAVHAAGPADAPVIVFAHGFSLDLTTWYYQWTTLSQRFRCVLYDQRAHGRSPKPVSQDYSVRAMGEDLHAVLEHADVREPTVLVGHSLGGMSILSFAEKHPEEFGERVRGVVFADTGASDLAREFLGDMGARAERVLRPVTRLLTSDLSRVERFQGRVRRATDLALLVARTTQFGPDPSPWQIEYTAGISTKAPVEVWVHGLRELATVDLTHVLEHVRVPALVVVGDRDMVTPKTSALALQKALPDARAVVITRAGHISMMEQHRVFNEVLDTFLAGLDLGRRGRRRSAARK